LAASNIHYELSRPRSRHRLRRHRGRASAGQELRPGGDAIDRRLHLLKVHLPYHESDHVLTIAYNILAGGQCLEDLETLRQDEGFLDALGAKRIPDPTTAGDFCRRFTEADVWTLQDVFNQMRQKVWALQGRSSSGGRSWMPTARWPPPPGSASRGWTSPMMAVGLSPAGGLAGQHQGTLVPGESLREPAQPRGGARLLRPEHRVVPGGGVQTDAAAGRHRLQQTAHLDRWDAQKDVKFLFGIDAMKKVKPGPRPCRKRPGRSSTGRPGMT
jgi:hypothetical protein